MLKLNQRFKSNNKKVQFIKTQIEIYQTIHTKKTQQPKKKQKYNRLKEGVLNGARDNIFKHNIEFN